jgi:mRNA interferase MazF
MKRGEIWTVAGGSDYASKPRPCVIIQNDAFNETASITVCSVTSDPTESPAFRMIIEPTEDNGLERMSRLMADKVTTVPKSKLGKKIGQLNISELQKLNQSIIIFLGLADTNNDTLNGT